MERKPNMKRLELVKGSERFTVDYEIGQESAVCNHLIEMVHNATLSFDWFDAAILSHQLGQKLAAELREYLPKKGS